MTLWRRRELVIAAAIALSYVAYLWTGELATLRVRDLVGPVRPGSAGATGRFWLVIREEQSVIPSNTRTSDDSVILDRPELFMDGSALAGSGDRATPQIPVSRRPFSESSAALSWPWWRTA